MAEQRLREAAKAGNIVLLEEIMRNNICININARDEVSSAQMNRMQPEISAIKVTELNTLSNICIICITCRMDAQASCWRRGMDTQRQ